MPQPPSGDDPSRMETTSQLPIQGLSQRILVIKLGAMGDVVQALGPMAAIRRHHPEAHITVLTTAPYETLLRASAYFDEVWLDTKPIWTQPGAWLALRARLRSAGFHRVYDLQTSKRSCLYYQLYWPGPYPEWSGIARGCSHPHATPDRNHMHTADRQADQLFAAGITQTSPPDLFWADSDTRRFDLTEPICLIVPGGAPHRLKKRWPADHYAALATALADRGVTPVLLGTNNEVDLLSSIAHACPAARNLCGETTFLDLAALARRAAGAVGNDTGPMHLLVAAGCPSTVLFSTDSDPALCAPRGHAVTILRRADLHTLPVSEVLAAVQKIAPALAPFGTKPHPPRLGGAPDESPSDLPGSAT